MKNLNHLNHEQPGRFNAQIPSVYRRILRIDEGGNSTGIKSKLKKTPVPMKATVRPNPFFTSITLDVVCDHNMHIIVRMFDKDGKIVKMFSWYVVRGTNVTAIHELANLNNGDYTIDIVDSEGNSLYTTTITKS